MGKSRRSTDDEPRAGRAVTRRGFLQASGLGGLGAVVGSASPPSARARERRSWTGSSFDVDLQDGAITSLRYAGDTIDTEYVDPGARLGDVGLRYRTGGGEWRTLNTEDAAAAAGARVAWSPDGREHRLAVADDDGPEVELTYVVEDAALRWGVTVRNPTDQALEVGDLGFPLPMNRNRGTLAQASPTPPILKHGLVSGDGSFFFWMRSNSVGPYLTLTVDRGTRLEYWESQGAFRAFIHSAAAGAEAAARGSDWRQPNTSLELAPGEERDYGLTFRWADDYDHVRRILVDQGLIDVHVVPGMTLPNDLSARVALRTNEPIHRLEPEFPDETRVRPLGRNGDAQLYEVRFRRLGENLVTVHFGDGRSMVLEFFSTEPLETVIAKRGAFIAAHQHRNPDAWYDGLLAEWAMDTHVMLGPDDYDRIEGWRRYVVTANDAGLGKPAFLSAKNAEFPVQEEVEALDYYIENFLWGGLQQTNEEPFPYGVYHTPDWKHNRGSLDPGRGGQQHVWRIYDFPPIILTYLGMYRVARHHPWIRTAMTAEEYLRRAYGTAVALFTVPWETERWTAYETGLMNGPVVEQVIDALYAEGMRREAERLRPHWERKVRTFVVDRPDLFRSEYAFDTTGFEATHALAKYALRVAEPGPVPEGEIRAGWVDYPPPTKIPLDNAREFMETQIAANVFCRGWLEPSYWILGSDIRGSGGTGNMLSYMAQLGGWSVLDHALHHAEDPAPHLRLGYASFLSSWALVNCGPAATGYGFWYPGPENDGAAAGAFEPAPYGQTWLGQPHTRGAWYYSGEIDIGFCGGLRCARTVIADDPIFGRFTFGGDWREVGGGVEVTPKDGVRRRFHALLGNRRLHLESLSDRFASGRPLALAEDLTRVRFEIESDHRSEHLARIRLEGAPAGAWEVRQEGRPAMGLVLADGYSATFEVAVQGGASGPVDLVLVGV